MVVWDAGSNGKLLPEQIPSSHQANKDIRVHDLHMYKPFFGIPIYLQEKSCCDQ